MRYLRASGRPGTRFSRESGLWAADDFVQHREVGFGAATAFHDDLFGAVLREKQRDDTAGRGLRLYLSSENQGNNRGH